ncbi:hypothetical protein C6Q14_18165 [Burkholderia ambifaria]|nr:hypothetical protein C6Q14_18165 [Burkholderia ambifaria]
MRFLQGRAGGAAVVRRRDCTWSARTATRAAAPGGGRWPTCRARVGSGRRDYNAGLECNRRATR